MRFEVVETTSGPRFKYNFNEYSGSLITNDLWTHNTLVELKMISVPFVHLRK